MVVLLLELYASSTPYTVFSSHSHPNWNFIIKPLTCCVYNGIILIQLHKKTPVRLHDSICHFMWRLIFIQLAEWESSCNYNFIWPLRRLMHHIMGSHHIFIQKYHAFTNFVRSFSRLLFVPANEFVQILNWKPLHLSLKIQLASMLSHSLIKNINNF